MTNLIYDHRWIGAHGIGRFAREIGNRLSFHITPVPSLMSAVNPLDPIVNGLLLIHRKNDLYFSPGFNPPLFIRRRLVFVIHDLIHIDFLDESTVLKRIYYHFFIRPAVRKCFRVLTDSEFSRKRIIEWSGVNEAKVEVVGCGVDNNFSPTGAIWQPGYRYVLYIGNKKPHKNLSRMLKAFKMIIDKHEVRLVLSGHPNQELLELAHHINIDEHIVFLGDIDDKLLPNYYRGAELFIFPSLYEGFGLPPLEAMACGTPVVVANTTSLPEVVGHAAIFVDPNDVDSIAAGIELGLSDQALRQRMRLAGIERAKLFSWEQCASKVNRILAEAAE